MNYHTATCKHIKVFTYRKPSNCVLTPKEKAPAGIVDMRNSGRHTPAFCPFYGDKSKGCRCHEPLNAIAKDILKSFLLMQEITYLTSKKVMTLRSFYKGNGHRFILAYGVDWQNVKTYVKAHRLEQYQLTLIQHIITSI